MGQQESKPEDIVAIARQPVSYSPPLGPPVRVITLLPPLLPVNRRPETRERAQGNPIVYLDIKLGRYGEGTPLGRVMIELKARRACA